MEMAYRERWEAEIAANEAEEDFRFSDAGGAVGAVPKSPAFQARLRRPDAGAAEESTAHRTEGLLYLSVTYTWASATRQEARSIVGMSNRCGVSGEQRAAANVIASNVFEASSVRT